MTPVVVFDLDGTLIDSAPDLHAAAARLLTGEGLPPLSLETVRSFIGNGIPVLVERIIGASELKMSDRDQLLRSFLHDYEAHATDLTRPYPHVPEVLLELKDAGNALGICTNKPHSPAVKILAGLGLGDYFDHVVGGDSVPMKKPDPAGLRQVHETLGGGPVVYIGDSEVDADTASRTGFPFVLFTEGYRKAPVSGIPHAASFSDFRELPKVVQALTAGFRER